MKDTYLVTLEHSGSVSRAELTEYIKSAVVGWSGGGEPGPLMDLTHEPGAVTVTPQPNERRDAYVLKYVIDDTRFRRVYADKKRRDDYADILAAQGITVICKARRAREGEVLQ